MTFKSAFGNLQVNEELVSKTVHGSNGIAMFGTKGKIENIIPVPIDSNLYIKGGHMQYDTFTEIENIPADQRVAGMEAHLNTNIESLSPIATVSNPGAITSTREKVYAVTDSIVYVVNAETNTVIKTLDATTSGIGTGRYILATTNTHIYISAGTTSHVFEIDAVNDVISRIFTLTGTSFMTNAIIADDKLYVSDVQPNTYVHIINLTSGVVSRVQNAAGSADAVFQYPAHMNYSTTESKVYVYGGSFGGGTGQSDNVYVINHTNGRHINTIFPNAATSGTAGMSPYYTGSNNRYQVFFPTTKKIYASSRTNNTIFAINTVTDTVSDIIQLPINSQPSAMLAVGTKLYVINTGTYFTSGSDNGDVTVIDLLTNQIEKKIELELGTGGGVAQVDYYQFRLFVPNGGSSSISVINTNTNNLIGNFPITGSPRAATYVTGTSNLYIANQSASLITGLSYQANENYVLQSDLTTWEKMTSVSKAGDYVDGLINYKTDLSSIYTDRSIPDVGYIKSYIDSYINTVTSGLKSKVIEIGDWDMDANANITVAHGIVDYNKIRNISVIIRNDSAALQHLKLNTTVNNSGVLGASQGDWFHAGTNITLYRLAGGVFDSTAYDSTGYNRGWITVWYED